MPDPLSADQADRIRRFLKESGYTQQGLEQVLGSAVPPPQAARPRALYLVRDPSRLNVLIELFFLEQSVPASAVRDRLPDWFTDLCLDSGLLDADGDSVGAAVLLVPLADFVFASDPLWGEMAESSEFVLPGSSRTAHYMLDFALRRSSSSTLDLGTGCGILAHFASLHSDRVIATDINPRATRFAELNARLNGRDNIDCRTGDLFEPVADERFDLILTNPPFVLAPSSQFVYRDNDMLLDDFCRMLAGTAPRYLRDGGHFQMICEWVDAGDQPWHERLGDWFEDSGCDVWVLHAAPQTPSAYTQTRITEVQEGEDAFDEWMEYYRANDVRAVYSGVITMRRRDGQHWIRYQALSDAVSGPVHDVLERGWKARDRLDALSVDEILRQLTPRVADDAALEQVHRWNRDRWTPEAMGICLKSGLRDQIQLDQSAVEFITQFDGAHTVAECIGGLAEARDEEFDAAVEQFLPVVRAMIERGFLLID